MKSLFQRLKLLFAPPKKSDPIFGDIVFMYNSKKPSNSYWECDGWRFAPANAKIFVALPGDESGPTEKGRQFYLQLASRFPALIKAAASSLAIVYKEWIGADLPEDIFKALKLTSFSMDDIEGKTEKWSMSFETRGKKWISITVPFQGDIPGKSFVDGT